MSDFADHAGGERLHDVARLLQRAGARVDVDACARATASSSLSRIFGVKAPTRSRCAPGFSQAPLTSGSLESVAQETMSASRTAASRSAVARTE